MTRSLLITGAIGSPYTRKMLSVLRYRRIPYEFVEGFAEAKRRGLPETPLPLLPGIYHPEGEDGWRVTSDSTFQLRELEERYAGRSVIPTDPVLDFLAWLVEDYADEWVTKAMFHYRWGVPENVEHASKVLPLWNLTVPDEVVENYRTTFAQRQIDRLSGVVAGSVEVTGPILEASYRRLLGLLRDHFRAQKFLLGERPSAGDFGLQGQLTQLVQVEPTSMALARAEAPRVMAWVDVVDDLSGLEVDGDAGWTDRDALPDTFRALLGEIGRTCWPTTQPSEPAPRRWSARSTAGRTGRSRSAISASASTGCASATRPCPGATAGSSTRRSRGRAARRWCSPPERSRPAWGLHQGRGVIR
jgi:glutathione S-transferase